MSRILGILDSGALVRRARRDAAVALQSCWRGKSARLRIARSREAREVLRGEAYGAAITVLQAAVRGRMGFMDAQGKRSAANILKVCFSQCLCVCRLDLLSTPFATITSIFAWHSPARSDLTPALSYQSVTLKAASLDTARRALAASLLQRHVRRILVTSSTPELEDEQGKGGSELRV